MPLLLDLDWTHPLLGFVEDLYHSATRQRGQLYALEGLVRTVTVSEDGRVIRAAVLGSRPKPYLVELKLEEEEFVDAECSCPVTFDCKHAYALALMMLGEAYRNGSEYQAEIKRHLPPAWRNYAVTPAAGVLDGVRQLYARVAAERQPAPVVSAPVPPAPPAKIKPTSWVKPAAPGPPLPPWWERLWAAQSDTERERLLLEAYERRIGPTRFYHPYDLLARFKGQRNNAVVMIGLEEALARSAAAAGRKLLAPAPEYLAFVNSPEVQTAYRQYQETIHRSHLKDWLNNQAEVVHPREGDSSCALELQWKLMPTAVGVPMLSFELLITTAKMKRRSRKPPAIRQLAQDLQRGSRQTTPLMRALVDWLNAGYDIVPQYQYYDRLWEDDGVIPVHNLLAWIAAWGGRGVLRWADGAAVGFDPRAARLVIERTAEGRDLWMVEFPPSDEAPAGTAAQVQPLTEAAVFSDKTVMSVRQAAAPSNSFYVRRGGLIHPLDAAGMSAYALAAARALETAPLELFLERPQGVRLMRRLVRDATAAGDDGRDGGGLVRRVTVRPVVELKLLRGEWVTLAAYARSQEGYAFLRAPDGEWVTASADADTGAWAVASPFANTSGAEAATALEPSPEPDPPAPADVAGGSEPPPPPSPPEEPASAPRLVLPRPEDLTPLEGWLSALIPPTTVPLNHGQERYSYQWPATGEAVALLLRQWAERPAGPLYLGNTELLKLITPAPRPALKVSVEPSGVDWLQVSVEMEEELAQLSARDLRELLAASEDALLRLPDGRFYQRQGLEEYQRELEAIEQTGLAPGNGSQRLHAIHLAGEGGKRLIELGGADERLAELARAARKLVQSFKGIPSAAVTEPTAAFLRPYQRQGADFLAWSCRTFGGALLADDMGLGKTIQVLAALTALRRGEKKRKPSLVICPASVAQNWQREARRFAPGLKTLVIERGNNRKAFWERLGEYDLVIKNYALTRRDAEVIRKYDWLLVCVDEAQAIKNPQAEIAAVVKSLPARYRIALTGTPIENRLGDLISIMEFAAPGFLPPLEQDDPALLTRRLRGLLRPVLLRRLKSEVAPELPERIEERIDCALTENQRRAYLAELKRTRALLEELPGQKVAGAGRIQILAALTRLRQLCCDPALVQLKDLGSGKVEELLGLLPPILEAGHKVLVFSQFVRMLHRLQDHLKALNIPTYLLTGQTRPGQRQELVDNFERDATPSVFLISLKAGGTGLNLVSASHVVLFDPWWNPAVEAQAIDRTHRIGQDKTVLAFRLVAEGTIEERIMELQERKRGLVRNVLEDEAFNRTLSREDFEFLLA